jgi:uncharacterized protein (TIGR02186 family)
MIRTLIIAICLFWPWQAAAKPLIADLSQYNIAINSSFMGTKLILFGARQTAGDVVVVIRGPARDYTLRKKDRLGGIWVNRTSLEVKGIPDYYTIASTKPLDSILSPEQQRILEIGIPELPYLNGEAMTESELTFDEATAFRDAFIEQREQKRLYNDNVHAVSFMGDTLFKTTLPFPDTIPRGNYTAETYLIYNGQIVGVQSTPLTVAKTGFDAAIFQLAHEYPVLYGILAVFMAITAGWGAAALFKRL